MSGSESSLALLSSTVSQAARLPWNYASLNTGHPLFWTPSESNTSKKTGARWGGTSCPHSDSQLITEWVQGCTRTLPFVLLTKAYWNVCHNGHFLSDQHSSALFCSSLWGIPCDTSQRNCMRFWPLSLQLSYRPMDISTCTGLCRIWRSG